ncbi:MAG: hypothetical protein OEM24_10025 [Paracoccaceae bacterium]|nr:hypothetical protein [Paracoccaceae bacterium]
MVTFRIAALSLLLALPAKAENLVEAGAAGLRRLEPAAAERLLSEVVNAVVMAQNCPAYGVSDGDWTLLTGTGDVLAVKLGLGIAEYDRRFWGPAFAELDRPGACGREGPKVRLLVQRLIAGGA